MRTTGTILDQIRQVLDARPVAAAERIGDGFVVVVPRQLVTLAGAGGQISEHPAIDAGAISRNTAFVGWLVPWLRGLAEGTTALVPSDPTGGIDTPFCVEAPGFPGSCTDRVIQISQAPSTAIVPAEPPAGDLLEEVPAVDAGAPPPASPLVEGTGARIGYGGMPLDVADASVYFAEAAAMDLDALIGGFTPERLVTGELDAATADSVRAAMAGIADAAEAGGSRWLVGGYYTGHVYNRDPSSFPSSVGAQRQAMDAPPLLYAPLWDDYLIPAAVEVASASSTHPGIAGILVDMEMYGTVLAYTDMQAFDDTTWNAYLDTLTDAGLRDALAAQPVQARLDALLERGILGDYVSTLERLAAEIGARYRDAVRAVDPDFVIALYFPGYPASWQYRGLIRGLGSPENPVVVLTYDPWSHPARADSVLAGTSMIHVGGPILSHFPPDTLASVLDSCASWTDGFWYYSHAEISALAAGAPAHGTRAAYRAAISSSGL